MDGQFKIARHIFGSHESEWATHKDFWSAAKFKYVLNELGFENIEVTEHQAHTSKRLPDRFAGAAAKIVPSAVDSLDNVTVKARKSTSEVDLKAAARWILEKSLLGKEQGILEAWLKEI